MTDKKPRFAIWFGALNRYQTNLHDGTRQEYCARAEAEDVASYLQDMRPEVRDVSINTATKTPAVLVNEIIEQGGRRWMVREAKTREDALNAIAESRCSGSVGARQTHDKTLCGGGVEVLADVVQINSDGTERQPYTESY